MRRASACTSLVLGCLVSVTVPMAAQEVVHALTGTVSSIDGAGKKITVFQDNGTTGEFQILTNPKTHLAFDKKIEAASTAADAFKSSGAYVIVFYFGDSKKPTVAALKSLGAGPFTSTVGKVEKVESRNHSVSVSDSSGKVLTFNINADTVAEGSYGAEEGLKAHLQTGDQVRVISTTIDGNPTALFLKD